MGFFSNFFKKSRGATKLTKCELTQDFAKCIKERFPEATLSVLSPGKTADISINIQRPNQVDKITFYPDNLYETYLEDSENFETYCENILISLGQVFTSNSDESPVLLPAIKTSDWLDGCKRAVSTLADTEDQNEGVVNIPLAGDLVIVFVLDTSSGMSYLYDSQLTDYSAEADIQEVYQHALENFEPYLAHIQTDESEIGYIVYVDGNYDTSLILGYKYWANNLSLTGEPVIALMARNLLVVADSNNASQVERLRCYAKQRVNELPCALSAVLYTLKNDRLSLYDLN